MDLACRMSAGLLRHPAHPTGAGDAYSDTRIVSAAVRRGVKRRIPQSWAVLRREAVWFGPVVDVVKWDLHGAL